MKKLIAIVGPTASGKTDLGIKLAKNINGQIVSIDSRQVYKGMDIGTAKAEGKIDKKKCINIKLDQKTKKICPFVSENINHWMIDIANPIKESVTVTQFQDITYQIIFKLFSKNITPILVGGSMMYMDAILNGYIFPKTSLKLREELSKYSHKKLLQELKKIDKLSYDRIDKKNKRRVLRALESYLLNRTSHLNYKKKQPKFDYLMLGIDVPRKELYGKIDQRVDERFAQGMIDEVYTLHKKGLSYKKMYDFGLEYRYISQYLKGEISKTAMMQKLKYKIHAFARRQLTWWRKNKKIIWLKKDKNLFSNAKKYIKNF